MVYWRFLVLQLLGAIQICNARECDEFTDLDFHHAFIGTSLKVRLLLHTRHDPSCGQELSHHDLSSQPRFNLSRPTTLVIHGYRPTGSPPVWLYDIARQLLSIADLNVLLVDWNSGAANVNYLKAVENTKYAADNITAFIRNMQNLGASLNSIHLIGVSLGAHMSGFVGANFDGKIGRITALDPAGPQFTNTDPEDRLDPTDAQFIDVLHTDMDALGFRKTLGHIDFYANGGADQPGCPKTIFSGGSYFKCDHQRSVFLYLESMKRTCPIRAYPCSSYKDFLDGLCMDCSQFNTSGCPMFGYDVVKWRDALMNRPPMKAFFTTNANSPFCQMSYKVEIVPWNQETRWCFLTIKLHSDKKVAKANIDHKASKFKKYTSTQLLAKFDETLENIQKISIKMTTRNAFKPKRKLRVLCIRLTDLERKDRPLCRYDLVLEENKELTFRPIPCEESNF